GFGQNSPPSCSIAICYAPKMLSPSLLPASPPPPRQQETAPPPSQAQPSAPVPAGMAPPSAQPEMLPLHQPHPHPHPHPRHFLPPGLVPLHPHVVPMVSSAMVMAMAMAPLQPPPPPPPPPPLPLPSPPPPAAVIAEKVVPLNERCRAGDGCRQYRTHAAALTPQKRQFCASHAAPDMVDTLKRLCRSPDCTKQAQYIGKIG
ncbi:unnamed protein product, partial [Pylaiella littoralis]